jgi:hypothetical protein
MGALSTTGHTTYHRNVTDKWMNRGISWTSDFHTVAAMIGWSFVYNRCFVTVDGGMVVAGAVLIVIVIDEVIDGVIDEVVDETIHEYIVLFYPRSVPTAWYM